MGISKELTEEDIKFRYINEAITSKGWSKDSIFMEQKVKFTDGKISLHGNLVHREKPKFADYVLYANKATPIAIVEAKDANHSVSHGLQQAMTYAQMLDVKFAYSSNGEGFAEHDFLTGKERTFAMDEFPTKEELVERYKNEANDGNGLNEQELAIIEQPFCTGQNIFPPRYYQRNAVNRTVGAIAKGQNRMLLVMATGTGKTYTAFQIVWRLLKSGLKKKVLYLADRNILVDQSIQQDFKPLEKVTHKIDYSKGRDPRDEFCPHHKPQDNLHGREGHLRDGLAVADIRRAAAGKDPSLHKPPEDLPPHHNRPELRHLRAQLRRRGVLPQAVRLGKADLPRAAGARGDAAEHHPAAARGRENSRGRHGGVQREGLPPRRIHLLGRALHTARERGGRPLHVHAPRGVHGHCRRAKRRQAVSVICAKFNTKRKRAPSVQMEGALSLLTHQKCRIFSFYVRNGD